MTEPWEREFNEMQQTMFSQRTGANEDDRTTQQAPRSELNFDIFGAAEVAHNESLYSVNDEGQSQLFQMPSVMKHHGEGNSYMRISQHD